MGLPMSKNQQRRLREELVDLAQPRRVHVVGVGGPGMAPLSVLLAGTGHHVTGSDMNESDNLDVVRRAGVVVHVGHEPSYVEGADVVVYSTAIPDSNVELMRARQRDIPVRHRSGLLEALCHQFDTVGVAGTHGKSTTSALVTHMLVACGLDPFAIVGADVPGLQAGARLGTSRYFVLEADESDGTLEVLALKHLVMTNVDVDHLDYFGTFEHLQDVIAQVIDSVDGVVVMNADDPVSVEIRKKITRRNCVTFGHAATADVRVVDVVSEKTGLRITVERYGDSHICEVPLRGVHNAMNVAAAIAMVGALGGDISRACASLPSFRGVQRRFTERGYFHGALLVDDYAHLPAEIDAAILAMRSHPEVTGRVVAVFQPNRFHRIAAMSESYADAFQHADRVVITDIYASGTEPIEGVTGQLVWQAIVAAHPDADVVWAPNRSDVIASVDRYLTDGDGCISMGCGDIETFPDELLQDGRP